MIIILINHLTKILEFKVILIASSLANKVDYKILEGKVMPIII
jgi:hypothetical protein